eukprot:CAMPEP_0178967742 /NCGR_PEP_ID=MMETSP0789-20121207/17796_1 /TAXON_ID=3005 /ORGANISM="Rhizosolenia setigera, Strain CCMP 1694" /LENGTH=805 /DNA_ID=CAMNT_0020653451 /DNA_START=20 /DNA_END=2437 /DNA_ORIENTATION=+
MVFGLSTKKKGANVQTNDADDLTEASDLTDYGKDYDIERTKLYSLIEQREWKDVVTRCTKFPMETCTWIYRKEKNGKIRWRMLPLHAAIIFGGNYVVLHSLIRSFPKGAEMQDDQGMVALHLAFRHNSTEDIVNLLLDAYPAGATCKDKKGRIPITLVKSPLNKSSNKEAASPGKDVRPKGDTEDISSMRSYMAHYIQHVNKTLPPIDPEEAQSLEEKMQQLKDSHVAELQKFQEEREKENQKEWEMLYHLESELLKANQVFKKWATDEKPDFLVLHNKDYLSRDELHESLLYSIQRFTEKAASMEKDKAEEIEKGLANHDDLFNKEKDKQVSFIKKLIPSLSESDKIDELSYTDPIDLEKFSSLILKDVELLQETTEQLNQKTTQVEEYETKFADLTKESIEEQKKIREERSQLDKELDESRQEVASLKSELESKNKKLEEMEEVSKENELLQKKVEELLTTMMSYREASHKEVLSAKSDFEKTKEELDLANDALGQAGDAVSTLEEQMAKLYVEREELKSRLFSLTETSSKENRVKEEQIHEMENSLQESRDIIEMMNDKNTELQQKFDGLSALRDRELEIHRGRETLLTAKVENLTTRYESFQDEMEEFNQRTSDYENDLQEYKDKSARLQRELRIERERVISLEKKLDQKKDEERTNAMKVHDMAENFTKVSMDKKRLTEKYAKERLLLEQEVDKAKELALRQMKKAEEMQRQSVGQTLEQNSRVRDLENENSSLRNSLEEMAKKLVRVSMDQKTGTKKFSQEKIALETRNTTLQKSIADMKSEIENITSSINHIGGDTSY